MQAELIAAIPPPASTGSGTPARGTVPGILAFRIARHHLDAPAASLADAAGSWALQDYPPGTAALALAARVAGLAPAAVDHAVAEERSLVGVYNPRTAACLIPSGDVAAFGAALLPPEEDELDELVGAALPGDGSIGAGEAVALAGTAIAAALDGRVLSRDELHAELRDRLPAGLLPWCPRCESHHARRMLIAAAGMRGELCLAGRAGRQVAFARPDQWLGAALPAADPAAARAGLVRRYLRRYAPSTPADLAAWAGVPRAHADRCWALVAGELAEVDGGWALAEDVAGLATWRHRRRAASGCSRPATRSCSPATASGCCRTPRPASGCGAPRVRRAPCSRTGRSPGSGGGGSRAAPGR